MTSLTLRIPKGSFDDFTETVIQFDRQFLTMVAPTLGLSVAEVLRRCLGTGAATPIPVLWAPHPSEDDEDLPKCPWWTATGSLWRPCQRLRLAPTLACLHHDSTSKGGRLASDPFIRGLPKRWPVRFRDQLLWADPEGLEPALHEDGRPELEGRFRFTEHQGRRVAIFIKHEATT
jgi:hypothetical protein